MPSEWKLGLSAALLLVVLGSLALRAPRNPIDSVDLRRLVGSAVALYVVGAAASLSGRGEIAGVVYAAGILVCSLAVWLSRGAERGGGPEDGDREPPADEGPNDDDPDPSTPPLLDWDQFERERARWEREPVSR